MGGHARACELTGAALSQDARILFATRVVRLFAYGAVSVVLVLYLVARGVGEERIGALLAATLVGDALISLYLTTRADVLGRRRVLLASSGLLILAGLVFASTGNYLLLVLAATVGVISPSGNEVGPFLSLEQVALAQTTTAERRTALFARYNLVGSFATAAGSLAAGEIVEALQRHAFSTLVSYRSVVLLYAALGAVLCLLFSRLGPGVEPVPSAIPTAVRQAPLRARGIVTRLSLLFALDSFGGGFVVQSIVAYWFHLRFGLEPSALGRIFFFANLFAGVSALLAARVAARIGLLRTMVFTHLPSNVLLVLVPFMPNAELAIAVLLARFSISQMDVPTRQSYVLAVVPPEERSAALGITGVARTFGASLAPLAAAPLVGSARHAWVAFVLAGGLKIAYDLALLRGFRDVVLEDGLTGRR